MEWTLKRVTIKPLISPRIKPTSEVIIKATLTFSNGRTFEGIAHEHKGASYINKTSYVEVAQTSAWGRALACAGLAGTELASADEMVNALRNQK